MNTGPRRRRGGVTVDAETVSETTVTVECPACGDLHNYYSRDLGPLPVRPGDERTVTAKCYTAAARRSRYNARAVAEAAGIFPRRFTIRFPHQRAITE